MTRVLRTLPILGGVLVLTGIITAPAHATTPATTPVTVGQCYQLDADQRAAPTLPADAVPVPCSGPHNVEVISTGTIPAGEDPRTHARSQCTFDKASAVLGINRPAKGVVARPIMIATYNFADTTTWQCMAAMATYSGSSGNGNLVVPQTTREPLVTIVRRPAARTCLASTSPWISAPCTRGNVQLSGYMASKHRGAWPGTAALRAEAIRRCPAGSTSYSAYGADIWSRTGPNYVYCYRAL